MTPIEYRTAAENVIYLAACMINGEKPDAERVSRMNLEHLYKTADRHLLTGIVGYALEDADVQDPAFIQAKAKAIRKVVLFDAERAGILAELDKAGIWHMPLKGCILKNLYPKIGMRQMADNDILYDAARADDVKHIMKGLGYTAEHFGRGVHDKYFKKPVCNFEMHRALFGAAQKESLQPYYKNVRDRLVKDSDNCYGYHLSPEDFYIYLIAHEYKHYCRAGTGIRSLLDTYVYLRKVPLDTSYIETETKKLGIAEFEAENRSLALHLFGGEPLTEKEREMLDYILSSGTYGTLENSVRSQIDKKGRWGYFRSRLMPPYDLMTQVYPVLKKVPLLYPFCWLHRLIHAFFFKHKIFMYQLKAVLSRKK